MTPAGDGSHGELDPDTPTREHALTKNASSIKVQEPQVNPTHSCRFTFCPVVTKSETGGHDSLKVSPLRSRSCASRVSGQTPFSLHAACL
jgi:hypothetical protein